LNSLTVIDGDRLCIPVLYLMLLVDPCVSAMICIFLFVISREYVVSLEEQIVH
jgi:hypothetical protein